MTVIKNKKTLATIAAATALLLMGGVGGAVAAEQITSAQIKNRTIKHKDLKKGAVISRVIKNGTVKKI